MAKRTEVCEAVAAVCQAQREVAQDAPGVVIPARVRVSARVSDSALVSPSRSASSASSAVPERDTSPSASAAISTFLTRPLLGAWVANPNWPG